MIITAHRAPLATCNSKDVPLGKSGSEWAAKASPSGSSRPSKSTIVREYLIEIDQKLHNALCIEKQRTEIITWH